MKTLTFSRRIATREEHDRAIARIREILESGPHPEGSPLAEERALLHLLTQDYCDRTYPPLPAVKSHEILEFLMEQNGLSQTDLVPFIGDKSTVSLVLAGKRRLTPSACRKLKVRFSVDFAAIVGREVMEAPPRRVRRAKGKVKVKAARA